MCKTWRFSRETSDARHFRSRRVMNLHFCDEEAVGRYFAWLSTTDFPILWPAWAMPWPVHEILILRFVDQYKFRWTEISWLVGGIVVVACSQLLIFPVLLNIKGRRGQRKARNNRWVLTCLANRTEPNITEYGNVCEHYVLSQLASWEQRQARSWLNRPGPGLDHI